MLAKQRMRRQEGFTITEMIVALSLFGLSVVSVMGAMNTIQQSQRSERYLDLANTAAKQIIEEARNGNYNNLAAGQSYDRTSSVSTSLPSGAATLTVSASTSMPDFKQLEVDVSYKIGSYTRHVYSTAIIGKGGISP